MSNPKTSFQVTQHVRGKRETVYQAWTDLETARKWSAPGPFKVSLFEAELRVGGKYRLSMTGEPGTLTGHGTYREIVPNQRLVYTWIWEVPDTEENLITVEFKDKGGDTEIVLTGEGFTAPDEVDSNAEGWAGSLAKLAKLFL